jgi:outer membrane protein OmpA-like peptidoglycan-associated protein
MVASTAGRAALAGAVLALSVGTAAADGARHGWYFGLDAGLSFVNDMDIESTPNSYSLDTGWAALGVVGYKFDAPALRLEFEAGFRDNDVGERNGLPASNGEVREISGLANLLWTPESPASNWSFTIGVGLGVDNVRFKDHAGIDSRDVVPAAQGIVGLNYRLNDHWDYALTYRVLFADVGSYDTTVGPIIVTGESDVVKHAVTLGFRYGYDDAPPPAPAVPSPPPPPAAAPPPTAKQFIVFFGFSKANLTAEAQAVIAEAATAAKTQGSVRILVVGHTDTVGSPAYNDRLSVRRAAAVRDELTRLGISPDAITAFGKGESELMVQTGDGIKEPQNRRATIDLQ